MTPAIKLGLTGSYAMGKSTIADMFAARGVAVHDADRAVHALLAEGGDGVVAVGQHFPETVIKSGGIDRKKLGSIVFADEAKREILESVLHPLVQTHRMAWLDSVSPTKRLVMFDIPLLFETGKQVLCDYTIVVSAPEWVQTKRALAREGMDATRLQQILARQMPDGEKRVLADYIIPTQFGISASAWYIVRVLADIGLRS